MLHFDGPNQSLREEDVNVHSEPLAAPRDPSPHGHQGHPPPALDPPRQVSAIQPPDPLPPTSAEHLHPSKSSAWNILGVILDLPLAFAPIPSVHSTFKTYQDSSSFYLTDSTPVWQQRLPLGLQWLLSHWVPCCISGPLESAPHPQSEGLFSRGPYGPAQSGYRVHQRSSPSTLSPWFTWLQVDESPSPFVKFPTSGPLH